MTVDVHESRSVTIRARTAADIPALANVLMAQQPITRYPFRNPLPFPVEKFLHAADAVAAWTAEVDGRPVGHVCRTTVPTGVTDSVNRRCAQAHGCDADRLAWVSTLFVGSAARGLGVGRRLLSTVVDDIRADGFFPCLEVLPIHAAALSLYTSTGWHEVMQLRPAWLREAAGDEGPDVMVMALTGTS